MNRFETKLQPSTQTEIDNGRTIEKRHKEQKKRTIGMYSLGIKSGSHSHSLTWKGPRRYGRQSCSHA